jgi:outer membrane protein OmpA-like peptidoglycan-associated protein
MPAVPAAPVASTTLSKDDLARSLSTPDRHKLAQDIDSRNAKAVPALPTPTPKAAPKPNASPPVNPDIIHTPAENVNAPAEKIASLTEEKRSPRPPPSNPQEMNFFSVPCKAGADDLDSNVTSVLQAQVLPLLKDHPSWKLQIQSFASPTDNEPISARKVSLSRALAVRSWLLDKGLEPRRMEVRALGLETDRDPLDRLDMVLIDPEAAGG